MSKELRPCPFCTAKAELVRGRIYAKHSYFCILYSQVVYDFKQTTWNSRPIEDDLRSKLAIAAEALEEITHCQWSEDDSFVRLADEALRKIRS